jgi:hypothetical protein
MSIFSIITTIRESVATLKDWAEYRRQTGKWPLLSIAAHLLNFFASVALLVLLIWIYAKKQLPRLGLVVLTIAAISAYVFLWSGLKSRVQLHEIRSRRRFAKMKQPE